MLACMVNIHEGVMESLTTWKKILLLHFSQRTGILFLSGTICVMSLEKLASVVSHIGIYFSIKELIIPFCIHIMLLCHMIYLYNPEIYGIHILSRLKRGMLVMWPLSLCKLIWNTANWFLIGFKHVPEPHISLIPLFLLVLAWLVLFCLSSYIVPQAVVNYNTARHFSLTGALSYCCEASAELLQCALWSLLTVSLLLFFVTFFMSYLGVFISFFIPIPYFKNAVEMFLGTSTYVFFLQLLSTIMLYLYMRKNHKMLAQDV